MFFSWGQPLRHLLFKNKNCDDLRLLDGKAPRRRLIIATDVPIAPAAAVAS
jgi:hypothetical protein